LKACILIRVRPGHHRQVAKTICSLPDVKEAFSVMGTADVVVRAEVKDLRAMTELGTKIGNLEDVVTAETLIAAEE
jgi:DNA-binding Lrp family transcriptional regulator